MPVSRAERRPGTAPRLGPVQLAVPYAREGEGLAETEAPTMHQRMAACADEQRARETWRIRSIRTCNRSPSQAASLARARRLTRSLAKIDGKLVVAKRLCRAARLRGKPGQQPAQKAAQQQLPHCPSSAAAARLHHPAQRSVRANLSKTWEPRTVRNLAQMKLPEPSLPSLLHGVAWCRSHHAKAWQGGAPAMPRRGTRVASGLAGSALHHTVIHIMQICLHSP
jgi:hypothetical protein